MEREPAHKDIGFIFSQIRKDMLDGADFVEALSHNCHRASDNGVEINSYDIMVLAKLNLSFENILPPDIDLLDCDELLDIDLSDLPIDKDI